MGGGESRREQETRRGEDLLTAGERAKELGEKEGRGFIGRNFPEKQSTCSRSDSKGRGGGGEGGEKKFSYHVDRAGLAKYFSNGLGFSCACLKH